MHLGRSRLGSRKQMMSRCSSILPRSLFLVIAAATLVLGPCFVNWYPNLRILEFSSSILAISISTAVPSCCLCRWCEMSPKETKYLFSYEREISGCISVLCCKLQRESHPWRFCSGFYIWLWPVLFRFPLFGCMGMGHEVQNDSHRGCLDFARGL